MDWSKYYPANWSAVTAEDVRMIRELKDAPVEEDNTNDISDDGEEMDKVQPKALKKKFGNRKDKDIDNDGDTDDSDKFLHKKRKAITKDIEAAEAIDPAIARAKAAEAAKKKNLQTQQGGVRKVSIASNPAAHDAAQAQRERQQSEDAQDDVNELSNELLQRARNAAYNKASDARDAEKSYFNPTPKAREKKEGEKREKQGNKFAAALQKKEAEKKRQSEDYQDDVRAAWYKGDDAYAAHKDANPQMHKKAPVKKKVSLPAPKSDQERRKDDWYAKKESWRPVDELSTELLKRAAKKADDDAATQRAEVDRHTSADRGDERIRRDSKQQALKRANQASKFRAAADVNDSPYKKAIRAKKESWMPVDEKRLKQKKSLNKKDYRDDNLKKRVKGIEEPDFSKKQDTVTNMEWAKNIFNNYHDIEEHCGWCDQGAQTESKELPTSKGIAQQIKELAKAVRGKDRLSIEGAASLVSKKDYAKLAPYLDKMSEDARQSVLMVLMTDQKVANSVMKKMKTEQYDECFIPSHKFILEGMYKKYHELTWGEIGERLIKNTERRLVSLAYATKMGTIDAPSPEVQKLADECELEDLEKACGQMITDDSDITERVVDEVIEMYNSLNEDEQTSFASFVNQLEDEEVLAELPNFMTHTGRVQNKSDKLTRKADAMQTHHDNLANIETEKERIASLKAKQKPGLLKKIGGAVKRGVKDLASGPSQAVKTAGVRTVTSDADKIADKAVKDQKKKAQTQTQQTKQVQTKADQGRAAVGADADKAQQKRMDAEAKERARKKLTQTKLADDPGLKKAAATSTRGKVLGAVGSALIGGSYDPDGEMVEDFEDQTPERLDARRRIFKEKIKKLAYEKAKEILGKRQPVEPIITKETNKNNTADDGEGLDAVQPDAVQKKFKNRKDKDIDNDGDADDSDKFLHKKRKAVSKAMKKEDDENDSKVKENGKINNKIKMEPEEKNMKESTGLAFVRKFKNKMSETNEDTSLQDQILELFRSSFASTDGEPVGAEFAVSDEPASASTIARTLRCSPSKVQKLLDDMVQAGQITRVGDAYSYASPKVAEPGYGVEINPTV